jgi:hypothetical protein
MVDDELRNLPIAEHALGIEDFDANQLLTRTKVKRYFVTKAQIATLARLFHQANIHGVGLFVVCDSHRSPLFGFMVDSKVKRVNCHNNNFIGRFHYNRRNLLNLISPSLPLVIELNINPVHAAAKFSGLPCTFSNRTTDLLFSGSSVNKPIRRVFAESDRLLVHAVRSGTINFTRNR